MKVWTGVAFLIQNIQNNNKNEVYLTGDQIILFSCLKEFGSLGSGKNVCGVCLGFFPLYCTAGVLLTFFSHDPVMQSSCLLWWYLQAVLVFIRPMDVAVWKKSGFQTPSASFGRFSFFTDCIYTSGNNLIFSIIWKHFVSCGLKDDSMMYLLFHILSSSPVKHSRGKSGRVGVKYLGYWLWNFYLAKFLMHSRPATKGPWDSSLRYR